MLTTITVPILDDDTRIQGWDKKCKIKRWEMLSSGSVTIPTGIDDKSRTKRAYCDMPNGTITILS